MAYRVDDEFARPDMVVLSDKAYRLINVLGRYSAHYRTDGVLERASVKYLMASIHAGRRHLDELQKVGHIAIDEDGKLTLVDFLELNPRAVDTLKSDHSAVGEHLRYRAENAANGLANAPKNDARAHPKPSKKMVQNGPNSTPPVSGTPVSGFPVSGSPVSGRPDENLKASSSPVSIHANGKVDDATAFPAIAGGAGRPRRTYKLFDPTTRRADESPPVPPLPPEEHERRLDTDPAYRATYEAVDELALRFRLHEPRRPAASETSYQEGATRIREVIRLPRQLPPPDPAERAAAGADDRDDGGGT